MRRSSVIMLLTAVVAGLHTLLFPAAPAQLLLAAFLAVLCALLFWMAAVLIQPRSVSEAPSIVAEEGQ